MSRWRHGHNAVISLCVQELLEKRVQEARIQRDKIKSLIEEIRAKEVLPIFILGFRFGSVSW